MEINAIISSVIPTIMERQKQNNQVMPDHQMLGELGNSETASDLYWNRLDMFLEYSEQLFWILENVCLIEVI